MHIMDDDGSVRNVMIVKIWNIIPRISKLMMFLPSKNQELHKPNYCKSIAMNIIYYNGMHHKEDT